jgi:hypothetical protein
LAQKDFVILDAGVQSKFEPSCGPLTQCGMKQVGALTNVCNAGLDANDQLDTVVKVHAI